MNLLSRLMAAAFLVCAGQAQAGVNSWTLTGPEGGYTSSIVFHPTNPSIMVAATYRGMYRSTNGGSSWDLVPTDNFYALVDLTYDPTNSSRIAGIGSNIYVSDDGGLSYHTVQGPATLSSLAHLTYDVDGTLYVSGLGGHLWKAGSSFTNWTELTLPVSWSITNYIGAMTADPVNHNVIYAGVNQIGLFRSSDGGATWSGPLSGGTAAPTNVIFNSIVVDPRNTSHLLVASAGGTYYSADSGTSWSLSSPSPAYWAGFDPSAPNRANAVMFYGTILRSVDGGVTFPQYGAELRMPNLITAKFAPDNSGALWLGTANGLAQSLDNGNTFTYRNNGILATGSWMIASADDGTVYASVNSGNDVLFRRGTNYLPLGPALRDATGGIFEVRAFAVAPSNSSVIFAVVNSDELVRTTDGGQTWSSPHPQFKNTGAAPVTALKIDAANPLVAYASTTNTGLWKTIDGGGTWTRLTNSPREAGALGIDPANPNTLYLAGGDGAYDHLYKSTNGGLTWTQKLDTHQAAWFYSLCFDPSNSSIVYAAGNGLWKSTDGGDSWTENAASLLNGAGVYAVLIDPVIPTTMVVVGNNQASGFLRSVDGGATFDLTAVEVPGRAPMVYQGVADPLSPNRLILGTSGAGIAEYEIAPDLEIRLAGPTQPVALGAPTSVTFTVRNLGPHASSASKVRMPLPQWQMASTPSGCTIAGQSLECALGVLRINETKSITVPFTAPAAPASSALNISVEGHETDPVASNNTAQLALQATEQADLKVAFTGTNAPADNHAALTLPIDVSNAGPNASTSTVLTVELAAQALTDATATASQGSCTIAGSTVTCALGTIDSAARAHVDVKVSAAVAGDAVVSASADGSGTDTGTDQAAARTVTIRPVGDAAVGITDSVDPATTDVPWQYTATVKNNGPDASTVTLTVSLTGAAPTAASSGGGTCTISGTDVSCALSSLATGASTTVTITANSSLTGSATASASVKFDGTDSSAANDTASASTTKVAPPKSSSSSGGGGGGGGRFDWIALLLLGLVVAQRRRRA